MSPGHAVLEKAKESHPRNPVSWLLPEATRVLPWQPGDRLSFHLQTLESGQLCFLARFLSSYVTGSL